MYEKCCECEYACRCCASHFMDKWPRCQECNNIHSEFTPSIHIVHCPIDGERFRRLITDVNGNIIIEV